MKIVARRRITNLLLLFGICTLFYLILTSGDDTKADQHEKLWQTMRRIHRADDPQINLVFDVPPLPPDMVNKAILLSYMRGGTTFVGSLFERNDDIFYVFEPEWGLMFGSLNEYEPLSYIDGSKRGPYWIDEGNQVIMETIQNYLYCNIAGIDIRSLKGRFMHLSQYTEPLYRCVRTKGAEISKCAAETTKICRSKPVRFLKTVRLRMELIKELLRRDPSLKIIHMIRDPRGIAISRMSWAEYYLVSATFTFGRVCAEILRDIETVETFGADLAERVFPVLYEDVAENPEAMAKKLYEFLGIPVFEKVRKYFWNITHAEKDKREGFSTIRANSSRTAYSWRSKIQWNMCKEIDRLCSRVYDKTGYLPVESEADLRNWNKPLRKVDKSTYTGKRHLMNLD